MSEDLGVFLLSRKDEWLSFPQERDPYKIGPLCEQ